MKSFRYILTALIIALVALSSCSKHKRPTRRSGGDPYNPEWIDIGTVVDGKKVYWATCNLGARNPWEYGNYYAWGELKPKDSYTKENYTYKDTPATLPLTADAANKAYGGKWRIPTKADYDALLALANNDDYTFENMGTIKDNNDNDVAGIKITQKSTGTVLFLPAAGIADGGALVMPGTSCYWTSNYDYSAFTDNNAFSFASTEIRIFITYMQTFLGSSIRPVRDE